MQSEHEIIFLDKAFLGNVIDALKSLDVRGYESNKRRTIVTMELERAFENTIPMTVEPNAPAKSAEKKDKAESTPAEE